MEGNHQYLIRWAEGASKANWEKKNSQELVELGKSGVQLTWVSPPGNLKSSLNSASLKTTQTNSALLYSLPVLVNSITIHRVDL